MSLRWDETWHRLREWTQGQGPSERLAAQVLLADGYRNLDPSLPLGGPDGGRDALVERHNERWVMAVYFPRGKVSFGQIRRKVISDYAGVSKNSASGMVFVTNQELTPSERDDLRSRVKGPLDVYHLERVVAVLDQPKMRAVREQYLKIPGGISSAEHYDDVTTPAFVRAMVSSQIDDTILFGRDEHIAQLVALLDGTALDRKGDAVTVVSGMAGSGKTALALKVALRSMQNSSFAGGAVQVDFRGYDASPENRVHASQVLPAVLYALGEENVVHDRSGQIAQFHSLLTERSEAGTPVLLLLDNVSEVSQIADILPRDIGHKTIVTTRNTLGPRIENSFSVRIEALDEDSAFALLVSQRKVTGQAAGTDDSQVGSQTESEDLRLLAQLCGRLPLALQIVSAILESDKELTVRELTDELADETERLSALEYEDLQVVSALNLSYIRLKNDVALCFRYLSLHPGSQYSVEVVARLTDRSSEYARRTVRVLENAHLLEKGSERGWWRMHDLVRLYSREQCVREDADDEVDAAILRMITYYEDAVQKASSVVEWGAEAAVDDRKRFPDRARAMNWLNQEIENVIGVSQVASSRALHEQAWVLSISCGRYLSTMGQYSTALHVAGVAVSSAESIPDQEKVASALNNVGLEQTALGLYEDSVSTFKRGLKICRDLGDAGLEAQLLIGFAEALRRRGNVSASVGPLLRAVRLTEKTKDVERLGFILTNLGISYRESSRFAEAISVLRTALPIHRRLGAKAAEASTLGQLGTALSQRGQLEEGEEMLRLSIDAAAEAGDQGNRAMMIANLANIYLQREQFGKAAELYQESLAIFRDYKRVDGQVLALHNLCIVYREMGQSALFERAVGELRKLKP
ncbi:tetratricopeptide repeat protein [Actinosynnema sp. NPDC051121]